MSTRRTTKAAAAAAAAAAARSIPLGMRACLAIGGIFCFTLFPFHAFMNDNSRSRMTLSGITEQQLEKELEQQQQAQQAQAQAEVSNRTTATTLLLETFALSFDPTNVEKLQERNKHSNLGPVLWVHGTDGMQQRTLDLWAKLTNRTSAPMTVEEASKIPRGAYDSPHAVGCYLSHWHLLRTLAHRHRPVAEPLVENSNSKQQQQQQQQHAYLILEDDASCAPGLDEEIARTIQQLPSDWDLLFVGGKPFSYYFEWNNVNKNETKSGNLTNGKLLIREFNQQESAPGAYNSTAMGSIKRRIRHAICQGDFGQAKGPLAPNGSRHLSVQDHQAYWRSDYLTNTHSYVVNPQRVAHVARLLRPTVNVPVDIRLADLMSSRQIKAYMTTRMWCDQRSINQPALLAPETWQGYFHLHGKYVWQTQMHLDDVDANCAF